ISDVLLRSRSIVSAVGNHINRILGELWKGWEPSEPCRKSIDISRMHAIVLSTPTGLILVNRCFVTELVGREVEIGCSVLMSRWFGPVTHKRYLLPSFQWTDFFLADVMCPTSTIDTLCAGQQDEIQYRTVNLVTMVPVVRSATHGDHGFTVCAFGIIGKFTRNLGNMCFVDACNAFLPCRCIRLLIVIINWIITREIPIDTGMSQH